MAKKIKMTRSYSDGKMLAGSEHLLDDDIADAYVKDGAAEYVDDKPIKAKTKRGGSRRSTKKASEER